MQKYTILGLHLYDYGVKEALRNTDRYLNTGALNTIAYISGAILAQASKDEKLKDCLENLDMTVCTEPDILEAAGIAGRNRVHEIDEKVYLRSLLRKLERSRKGVYLLSDTRENLDILREIVLEYQGNLNIRGCGAYEEFGEQPERLINELNDIVPDVIISRMPCPGDFVLMNDYRTYINAELWISLPYGTVAWVQNPSVMAKLKRKLNYKKFIRQVLAYDKKTDSE